ncbi:Hypothetical predicted protein [Paramuricea clavata]|uniref:Uncharacterized protein n=1 Tax=Paramuricea clavata TaxID=317549 RepID=A0A7D9EQ40_PARCT|nr:Hypothetical predicted protein [Paramuricea clavata]
MTYSLSTNFIPQQTKPSSQIDDYFGDVEPFIRGIEDLAPALRAHLLEIFDSPEDVADLKLEIAALIDGGRSFVTTTYNLEGDGPLIFTCYQHLTALVQTVQLGASPSCIRFSKLYFKGGAARFLAVRMSWQKPPFHPYRKENQAKQTKAELYKTCTESLKSSQEEKLTKMKHLVKP